MLRQHVRSTYCTELIQLYDTASACCKTRRETWKNRTRMMMRAMMAAAPGLMKYLSAALGTVWVSPGLISTGTTESLSRGTWLSPLQELQSTQLASSTGLSFFLLRNCAETEKEGWKRRARERDERTKDKAGRE